MVSKVIIIKSKRSLAGKLRYVGNANHRNHADIDIGPEQRFGIDPAMSTPDFIASWELHLDTENAAIRAGRRRTRFAVEEVVRTPDGAAMTTEEKTFLLREINTRMGGASTGLWHDNRKTGASDLHNFRFKDFRRDENPLTLLRQAADDAHNELNAWRRKKGRPHIETIVEVRRRRKKDKGIVELAEQLLSWGIVTAANVKDAIIDLGHTVTRVNPAKDTISVRHSGGKKAFRYSLSGLLQDMAQAGREQKNGPKAAPLPHPPSSPTSCHPHLTLHPMLAETSASRLPFWRNPSFAPSCEALLERQRERGPLHRQRSVRSPLRGRRNCSPML